MKRFIIGGIVGVLYWISGYVSGVCISKAKECDRELEKIRKNHEEVDRKNKELEENLYLWGLKKRQEEGA